MSETGKSRFFWHDLMTTDVEASKSFYEDVLQWAYETKEMGPGGLYTMIRAGGREIGGMVSLDAQEGLPSHWMSYVTVPDLGAALGRVDELGGAVAHGPTDAPGIGRFGIVRDQAGAHVSFFELLGEPPAEPEGTPAPGAPCWHELLTRDTEGSARFYGELCGWTGCEMDMGEMGTYTLFRLGEQDVAGMLAMPDEAEAPPFWLTYFAAADVDAAARTIDQSGGRLFVEPRDIPEVGRFCVAADPAAANFAVFRGLSW
jgi:predicted enzyme related to lactoylglutathione lyase